MTSSNDGSADYTDFGGGWRSAGTNASGSNGATGSSSGGSTTVAFGNNASGTGGGTGGGGGGGGSWTVGHGPATTKGMPVGWKCGDCGTVMAPWVATHHCDDTATTATYTPLPDFYAPGQTMASTMILTK